MRSFLLALSFLPARAKWYCYDDPQSPPPADQMDHCSKRIEEPPAGYFVSKNPKDSICEHLQYGDHECPYGKHECRDCWCCGRLESLMTHSANPDVWGPENLDDALGKAFNTSGQPNDGSLLQYSSQEDDDVIGSARLSKANKKVIGYLKAMKVLVSLAASLEEQAHGNAEGVWEAVAQLRKAEGTCYRNIFMFSHEDDELHDMHSSRRSGPGDGAATGGVASSCPPWNLGSAILEVDNIIASHSKMTLTAVIQVRCPHVQVEQPDKDQPRHYARVIVLLSEEDEVRRCIKDFAKEKGKRTNIKTVSMSFNSPPESPRF